MPGVFLMSPLTRRRANRTNIPTGLIGTTVCTVPALRIKVGTLRLGWTWLVVIGPAIMMALGLSLGKVEPGYRLAGEQGPRPR